jgi:hypothetical protein
MGLFSKGGSKINLQPQIDAIKQQTATIVGQTQAMSQHHTASMAQQRELANQQIATSVQNTQSTLAQARDAAYQQLQSSNARLDVQKQQLGATQQSLHTEKQRLEIEKGQLKQAELSTALATKAQLGDTLARNQVAEGIGRNVRPLETGTPTATETTGGPATGGSRQSSQTASLALFDPDRTKQLLGGAKKKKTTTFGLNT